MLTDNPIFKGKLVSSHIEPTFRQTDNEGQIEFTEERFKFVVDQNETVLATVTDQYTLVQNAEFVSSLDLAAESLGIRIEPIHATYHNGKGYFEFGTPDMKFNAPGDKSDTIGRITLANDYRGQGGLSIMDGWQRLVCSNGMTIGEVIHKDTKRHVGEIDVYAFVLQGLERYMARWETERIIAETLGNAPAGDIIRTVEWEKGREEAQKRVKAAQEKKERPHLIDAILADTANRYQADLAAAVRANADEMGNTFWALAQAVAEISTHRMQTRANGDPRTNFNFAADDWATRQLNRIREEVKVRVR